MLLLLFDFQKKKMADCFNFYSNKTSWFIINSKNKQKNSKLVQLSSK